MRVLDILVVDDERDLASGLADMLVPEGPRAALALTGRDRGHNRKPDREW